MNITQICNNTDRMEALREARIHNIVLALFMATSGQEIYDALAHVPDFQLQNMKEMCESLLSQGPDSCA